MLGYTTNAILSRAEVWDKNFCTEPYEAGWANGGILFLKTLDPAEPGGVACIEISPDGLSWAREPEEILLPVEPSSLTFKRFKFVGCYMRVVVLHGSPTQGQRILATACLKSY